MVGQVDMVHYVLLVLWEKRCEDNFQINDDSNDVGTKVLILDFWTLILVVFIIFDWNIWIVSEQITGKFFECWNNVLLRDIPQTKL